MTDQHLIPLEELNLSVRAYNCLKNAQVNSVSDLVGFSYEDLLEIKNFGPASIDDVIEALAHIGMTLHRTTPYLELFSPTARAVLLAYYCGGSKRLAAALRAAADQVVPGDKELSETYLAGYYADKNRQGPACQAAGLRAVLAKWGKDPLLAIADELERQ